MTKQKPLSFSVLPKSRSRRVNYTRCRTAQVANLDDLGEAILRHPGWSPYRWACGRRAACFFISADCYAWDFDRGGLQMAIERLCFLGWDYRIYPSKSYDLGKGIEKFRVIVRLERRVQGLAEFCALKRAARSVFSDFGTHAPDESCSDAARKFDRGQDKELSAFIEGKGMPVPEVMEIDRAAAIQIVRDSRSDLSLTQKDELIRSIRAGESTPEIRCLPVGVRRSDGSRYVVLGAAQTVDVRPAARNHQSKIETKGAEMWAVDGYERSACGVLVFRQPAHSPAVEADWWATHKGMLLLRYSGGFATAGFFNMIEELVGTKDVVAASETVDLPTKTVLGLSPISADEILKADWSGAAPVAPLTLVQEVEPVSAPVEVEATVQSPSLLIDAVAERAMESDMPSALIAVCRNVGRGMPGGQKRTMIESVLSVILPQLAAGGRVSPNIAAEGAKKRFRGCKATAQHVESILRTLVLEEFISVAEHGGLANGVRRSNRYMPTERLLCIVPVEIEALLPTSSEPTTFPEDGDFNRWVFVNSRYFSCSEDYAVWLDGALPGFLDAKKERRMELRHAFESHCRRQNRETA